MEAKTNLTRLDPAPAKSGGGTIVVKLGGLLLVVLVLVGIAAAAMPHVKVFGGAGTLRASFFALDATFPVGVSVGGLDRNNDGRGEIVVGDGPGLPGIVSGGTRPRSLVRLLDGLSLAELDRFFAFGPTFFGGVFVLGQ